MWACLKVGSKKNVVVIAHSPFVLTEHISSNIRDYSTSDQHKHAMLLLKRAQARDNGQDASSFAPIVKVCIQMSEKDKDMLRVKFDIAHFVATRQLSFTNYPVICQLENKHGLDVGMAYCNQNAGKTFCHFIAESKRAKLGGKIEKSLFSFQFLWMVLQILLTLMMNYFS